ncbi:Protein of unknown function [Chitinophaga sp. YR573]|uniref:phage portal protein family protein n=1 Tax=Chitinophaga sp. YR573 TaxID=1881040 RepID=UPI0008ADEE90|nr:DUF935 family protein [Chitinophaga sp. YR573]SEW02056.1 Protein of unknown function [Chitinophaga sp. YR573]
MSETKVTKTPGSAEEGLIIQNLIIRPVVRSTQDITTWTNAIKNAEALNPIRVPLYDLYESLLLDGTLKRLIAKRILGVTKTRLLFLDKSGKEDEVMKALISKKAFRDLRKERLKQIMWGITVVELSRKATGELKVFSVPRKHIKPKIGKIVWEQYGQDGIDYRTSPFDKYTCEFGESDDLGLLMSAAQYVIYKRGAFGDWSQYAEIFGMPFREARYDGYNAAVRAQLEQALDAAGSASYAILPKDVEFKLHESTNTANSSELYDSLRRACNEELCILILGQTETTTSSKSSGYAQSQTHAGVEEALNLDDREEELADLNETVLPILANLGYPVLGGKFVHEEVTEQVPKKDKVDIVVKLKTVVKLPMSDDYLYEEFNIPKPDNYDELKAKIEASTTPDPTPPPTAPSPGKQPKKADKKNPKIKLSAWHQMRLRLADFFDLAPNS